MESTNCVQLLEMAEKEMKRKSGEIVKYKQAAKKLESKQAGQRPMLPMFHPESDGSNFRKLAKKAKEIESEYAKAIQDYEALYRHRYNEKVKEKQKELNELKQLKQELKKINQKHKRSSVGHLNTVHGIQDTGIYQKCDHFMKSHNQQYKQKLLQASYDECIAIAIQCIREKLESLLKVDEKFRPKVTGDSDYRAYGLLLSACKLRGEGNSHRILHNKEDSIKKIMNAENISIFSIGNADILRPSIESALDIACNMMVLLPPAIVYQLNTFDEDLSETHRGTWDESKGDNQIVCYRPVLVHGGTNTVAIKGLVGHSMTDSQIKIPTANTEIVQPSCIQSLPSTMNSQVQPCLQSTNSQDEYNATGNQVKGQPRDNPDNTNNYHTGMPMATNTSHVCDVYGASAAFITPPQEQKLLCTGYEMN